MASLKILTFPDPFLKIVAKPVTVFDATLDTLVHNMVETMYDEPGIGLAATQVQEDKRLFVMDVFFKKEDPESQKKPVAVINPEIISASGESVIEEGCLSVPEVRAEIKRFAEINLRFQDLKQVIHELKAEGMLAICIQHELDHLNGKLFIDYLPPLKRRMIQNRLKKRAFDQNKAG
ncbi:MAG: peptide deformylase [SAR324 cluster bacterium]|nr:peptide deformylase [SAR324 cluster bacterium]